MSKPQSQVKASRVRETLGALTRTKRKAGKATDESSSPAGVGRFIGKNWTKFLSVVALHCLALYFLVMAYPWMAGVFLLAIGLLFLWVALKTKWPTLLTKIAKRRKTTIKPLLVPTFITLGGLVCTMFGSLCLIRPSATKSFLLDNVYGLNLNLKGRFSKKVESYGARFPQLWPITLNQTNRTIDISPNKGGHVLSNLLFSSDQGLFFLLGTAGTGKTPLLEQWAYFLQKEQAYDNVFFVSLRSEEEFLKTNPLLVELVADANRDIVADPKYYRILFEAKPCLVILDELDEIDARSAENVVKTACSLVRQTTCKVLIGSRPESVLLSDYYGRELKGAPDIMFLRIEPIEDRHLDFFIRSGLAFNKLEASYFNKIKSIIESRPAAKKMAVEVDHLNALIQLAPSLENRTDFDMVELLVAKRIERNIRSHWSRLGLSADTRMQEIFQIAYQMSSENLSQSDDPRLSLSGFVTVNPENGKFAFSPTVLQSYFAIKGLEENLRKSKAAPVLSRMLLEDLAQFPSVYTKFAQYVRSSFQQRPGDYRDSLESLRRIFRDPTVLYLTLDRLDKKELINRFVLKER